VGEELAVWLYGDNVASIDRDRRGPRLTYTPRAIDLYDLGTPLLSLVLPVAHRSYQQGVVGSFLDGLLPEGEARTNIARDVGESPSDTFGLIRALGRDCAGALVIQAAEDPPPPAATTTTAEALTVHEIGNLVRNLRSAPLGVGGRVRVSLAGVQEKLLLTRISDGEWGRPVDGTPSTHILKPEIAQFPMTVENEAFCIRVAKHLGLDVANVETLEIEGYKLIVVERFDRHVSTDGAVERIHQEDFCQARGISPESKYQDQGGPSLAQIASTLATVAVPGSLEKLLSAVVLDVLLGNGDAHAKNFSLLHARSGSIRLSPLYDLICTLHYGDNRLAMYIDGVRRSDHVTTDRIINEATQWGIGRRTVVNTIEDILERAEVSVAAAASETKGLPSPLVETVMDQLGRLKGEPGVWIQE
jgi:serine/threonine-protein kinase HipA